MAAAIGEAAGIHKAMKQARCASERGRPRGRRLLSRRLALEGGVRAWACPP